MNLKDLSYVIVEIQALQFSVTVEQSGIMDNFQEIQYDHAIPYQKTVPTARGKLYF